MAFNVLGQLKISFAMYTVPFGQRLGLFSPTTVGACCWKATANWLALKLALRTGALARVCVGMLAASSLNTDAMQFHNS